jgi:hypothetical protein
MKKLIILILFLFPLIGFSQHYNAGSSTPAPTGWTPPTYWVDSLGAITTATMGADGTLTLDHIKLLVNTRAGNSAFAFTVTCVGGYYVKWGRNETAIAYASAGTAERYYDTTKCQKYCVIEIYPQAANHVTAFAIARTSTFVAKQTQSPQYLWLAANYASTAPLMYILSGNCYSLVSAWFNSVTSFGTNCFNSCYALQSITIPSSVTSFGTNCFASCYALQSITISSSVTSLGSYCFAYCYALQSITIPSSVTSFGTNCFASCYALQSIIIPSNNTGIPASLFTGDVSLKRVTYTGTETSAGDKGSDWGYQCEQLDSLAMPHLKCTRIALYGQTGKLNKLGLAGNIDRDSVPFRIDYVNSTFSNATAPQLNLSYCSMTELQMRAILNSLPVVVGKTVTFAGGLNAASLTTADKAKAVLNGWTVLN